MKVSCNIWSSLMNFRLLHLYLLWLHLILLYIFILKDLIFIVVLIWDGTFFSCWSWSYTWLFSWVRLLSLKMARRETALINLCLSLSVKLSYYCHIIYNLLLSFIINRVSNIDVCLHHQLSFFLRLNHVRTKRFEWLLIFGIIIPFMWRNSTSHFLVRFMSKRFNWLINILAGSCCRWWSSIYP